MPRCRTFLAALASASLALLLTLGLTLVAAPATAHAGLTSSNPEEGATLDALPSEIVLEFTEEITTPAFVVVTDPDGSALQTGDPVIDGATVRQRIDPATQAGLHTIAYRVVSADGHPVQGHVRVTVELEGGDNASPNVSADTPASDSATDDAADEGAADTSPLVPTPLLVAGAVVLLLVVLLLGVLALTMRGRR